MIEFFASRPIRIIATIIGIGFSLGLILFIFKSIEEDVY